MDPVLAFGRIGAERVVLENIGRWEGDGMTEAEVEVEVEVEIEGVVEIEIEGMVGFARLIGAVADIAGRTVIAANADLVLGIGLAIDIGTLTGPVTAGVGPTPWTLRIVAGSTGSGAGIAAAETDDSCSLQSSSAFPLCGPSKVYVSHVLNCLQLTRLPVQEFGSCARLSYPDGSRSLRLGLPLPWRR